MEVCPNIYMSRVSSGLNLNLMWICSLSFNERLHPQTSTSKRNFTPQLQNLCFQAVTPKLTLTSKSMLKLSNQKFRRTHTHEWMESGHLFELVISAITLKPFYRKVYLLMFQLLDKIGNFSGVIFTYQKSIIVLTLKSSRSSSVDFLGYICV